MVGADSQLADKRCFMSHQKADAKDGMNRRSFCSQALVTSIGLGLVMKPGRTEAKQQSPPLAYPPLKIDGAEQLLPGQHLYFSYPTAREPAVVFRAQDGEFAAYSRKCAHLGCSVDFDPARRCLRCPCHQGVYDARTGTVMYGPPVRSLDQVILQVRAGTEVWAVGKRPGSNRTEYVVLSGEV